MDLSRTERWLLANQYRILEALYPDEADSYARKRRVLEDGYELHYRWIAERIYEPPDTMTEGECREVLDILDMFDALRQSRQRFGDMPSVEDWQVTFHGFDGNNETKQMAYARFLVEDGRFTDVVNERNLNSHMPSMNRYRRQLAVWRRSGDQHHLTADEIQAVAAAAPYPH